MAKSALSHVYILLQHIVDVLVEYVVEVAQANMIGRYRSFFHFFMTVAKVWEILVAKRFDAYAEATFLIPFKLVSFGTKNSPWLMIDSLIAEV